MPTGDCFVSAPQLGVGLGDQPSMPLAGPREIKISRVLNGYIAQIDCTKVVF